jgi:hypothetical protein
MDDKYHEIKEKYYKTKDSAIKYGWTLAGIAAPIVASRYILYKDVNGGALEEFLAWGASIFTAAPAIPFTGILGYSIGIFSALNSEKKRCEREEKRNLESKMEN